MDLRYRHIYIIKKKCTWKFQKHCQRRKEKKKKVKTEFACLYSHVVLPLNWKEGNKNIKFCY